MKLDGMETQEIQLMQDGFSGLAHVSIYCVDGEGKELTKVSGDSKEAERLIELVGKKQLYGLYERICASAIEDQIIEDTEYKNIKIAATAVRAEGKPILCWLACCVLEDFDTEGPGKTASDFQVTTSEQAFCQALDLIRMWMTEIVRAKTNESNALAQSRRSSFSEHEMSRSLKRTEAMTQIVQMLAGKDSFEQTAARVLAIMQDYLQVMNLTLFQLSKDGTCIDAIARSPQQEGGSQNDGSRERGQQLTGNPQQNKASCSTDFAGNRASERPVVMQNDKMVVVSSGTLVSSALRSYMDENGIAAFLSAPIRIRGEIAMYLFLYTKKEPYTWPLEEVKFTSDAVRILQTMLEQRVARNSMASSYQSMTRMLNMVGSCVYVRDARTKEVLFANELLQHHFEQEYKQGTLDKLLDEARPIGVREGFYELHHAARNRWYDMHFTYINWVDGRKAAFYSLYDITDKKLYQKKIEQQAYTDFLTGLYNRMCCERDLSAIVKRTVQEGTKGGLLYLDLDDFKHINDGLGHQYGDVLLQSISNSLQRINGIRNSCYRMGGDEFVIIVPPESFSHFDEITEEIKKIFSKPWFLKDADYYCTMSMGICYFPENGEEVQDLIKKADIAMYEAKKSGKNRVACYSDKISSSSSKRLDMEKNMRNATTNGYKEFEVYYQPIIDIQKEGTPCTGAEALVRWNSAAFGFIPPSDFIPLAEYLGLINPIGNHVMKEACKACKYWNENGHPEYKVNVNLSVVQLLQTDIVEIVQKTIEETGINPHNLTLEVTESLAINDMERMKEILGSIRSLGARIALDDFGTGYSSLNHIREIPLDVIKVDQSFVADLTEDSYSQSFIKMVAELAGAIGVSICIEGIEKKEQYKVLEGMQVRLVQGYYFDRPMPRRNFEEKYLK